jgi:hypothetical protein
MTLNKKEKNFDDYKKKINWGTGTLGVLLGIILTPVAGVAGGLTCYLCIILGAKLKQITVTLYVGIFVLVALVVLMLVLYLITKALWQKKIQKYNEVVRRKRNENLTSAVQGGVRNGQVWPQQPQQQQPQQQQWNPTTQFNHQ